MEHRPPRAERPFHHQEGRALTPPNSRPYVGQVTWTYRCYLLLTKLTLKNGQTAPRLLQRNKEREAALQAAEGTKTATPLWGRCYHNIRGEHRQSSQILPKPQHHHGNTSGESQAPSTEKHAPGCDTEHPLLRSPYKTPHLKLPHSERSLPPSPRLWFCPQFLILNCLPIFKNHSFVA